MEAFPCLKEMASSKDSPVCIMYKDFVPETLIAEDFEDSVSLEHGTCTATSVGDALERPAGNG